MVVIRSRYSYFGLVVLLLVSEKSVSQNNPNKCQFEENGYTARWDFDPNTAMVNFYINANTNGATSMWTGIGINDQGCGNNCMLNADMLIVTMNSSGPLQFMDGYTENQRTAPTRDANEQIINPSGSVTNGVISTQFSHPLVAQDSNGNDKDMSLQCITFLFPYSGGPLDGSGGLGAHTQRPKTAEVCNLPINCIKEGVVVSSTELPLEPSEEPTSVQPPIQPQTVQPSVQPQTVEPSVQPQTVQPPVQTQPPLPQSPVPGLQACTSSVDNPYCIEYFDNYLSSVTQWATTYEQDLTPSIRKACQLIQNKNTGLIPAVCCNTFNKKCVQEIQ